jgi:pyruvate dehydrogenase E2 component (dihydrolipoyllysine-residue acetyltransferase)
MSVSVTMPRLGESVTEGTVTRWLKKEGERVEADEPLLEVSTDKVDTEVPSPASGVLTSIKVAEDETVDIGVELAVIGDSDDGAEPAAAPAAEEKAEPEPEAPAAPEPEAKAEPEPAPEPEAKAEPEPAPEPEAKAEPEPEPQSAAPAEPQAEAPAAPSAGSSDDEDLAEAYVTPLVRKLAGEHGVDLTSVSGTGVGGRIRKSDVLAAAAAAAAPPAAPATTAPAPAAAPGATAATPAAPSPAAAAAVLRGRTEKFSRRRAVIAARMVESLQTSAQLTTVIEADVTRVARLREAAKADFEAREGVKLSFLPFFVQATVEALKAHPGLNSSVDTNEGTVTYHDTVNLGIAVDTEQGLIVPVLLAAGDLNLGGIARKIADLAARTRANKISPDELSGGTFTLTNTGSRGALFDTPIINQPQVGILGTGSVVKRAVVISDPNFGETIAVRSMVYLALTYDHRIVDGADAARFLTTVKDRLEAGAFEGELGLS